jgi:hypothetical protein
MESQSQSLPQASNLSKLPHNKRMQPDFGKLSLSQPLMRGVMRNE